MDLTQLRTFVAIADAGGVSAAADRLHLSQPAVSRQLLTLEKELGLALFRREQRRMRLTVAGEDLLRRARSVLTEAESLSERARALQSGDTGVLKIGATPRMIETTLAGFLGLWRGRHPGIDIHIVEDGGSSLAERLENGEVHLAYVPAGDARFGCRLLYPIHLVAAVPAAHDLAGLRTLELAELARHPLLALKQGFGSRDWFDAACHVAGLHPAIVLESGSRNAVLALAAAGYGIGILASAVVPPRDKVALVPLVHSGKPIGRWTMLAWSTRRSLPRYAQAFIDEFSIYARQHRPGRSLARRAPRVPAPTEVA
jgi:LysR family transcriptional regulator, cyn operon transcriptional activator